MKKALLPITLITILSVLIYSCSSGDDDSAPPGVIQTPKTEPEETTTQYTLTVSAGEGGSVSSEGGTYDDGTEVKITATPNSGYIFSGWSDGSNDLQITIKLNSNASLSANFTKLNINTNYESPISPFLGNQLQHVSDNLISNKVMSPLMVLNGDKFFFDTDDFIGSNDWVALKGYLVNDFNNDGYLDAFFYFISTEKEDILPFKLYLFNPNTFRFEDSSDKIQNNIGQPFARKGVVADLNNDGFLDFILVSHPEFNYSDLSHLDVLLSNGIDSWTQKRLSIVKRSTGEGYYHGLGVEDVDNDGDIDFVISNWQNNEGIKTYLNDGSGEFQVINSILVNSTSNISMEKNSFTNELLYINNDNCVDLIYWGNNTYVKLGNCDGTFGPNTLTGLEQYDDSWDYKNVDLNDDGINELIIFNNDQQNNSAKLNVFQIQNSNETLEFQTSNSISFPSHVIAYFDIKKLSQEKFLFTPSQFIDMSGCLDQNPLYLSDNLYNIEIVNYPFTKPIENILFNNDEGKLNWETTLLPDEPNLCPTDSSQWTLDNLRGNIQEWYIYKSDRNFIYPNENGVEKLVISDLEIEKENLGNNQFRYKAQLKLDISQLEKKFIRISYKLDNGIINNPSYSISISK